MDQTQSPLEKYPADSSTSFADPPPPYEKSVASSNLPSQPAPSQIYHIHRTTLVQNYEVLAGDKSPLYFVDSTRLNFGGPDLTFHVGGDKDGRKVSLCKFERFSGDVKTALLQNPSDANSPNWNHMTRESWVPLRYRWTMTVMANASSSNSGAARRSFVWKHTHSVGVQGSEPSLFSHQNYKLVDEKTNQIAAVFTGNILGFKKSGKLQINEQYGDDFNLMVLTTLIGMIERYRRRSSAVS